MAAVNYSKIAHFCAIFLPPADLIVANDEARDYFSNPGGEAMALVNAVGADPVNPDNVIKAQKAFEKKSNEIEIASHAAANQWVDNAFSALQTRLPHIPTVEDQYADDTFYIVMSPEFGLNGWKDSPGDNGITKWDASGAFPESLEAYIKDRVRIKLTSGPFIHFHILFVFSCFTHSKETMVPQMDLGKGGPPKIAANNRLNIVCLESATSGALNHMFATVTKFDNNRAADRVPPIFTQQEGWDSTTQASTFGKLNRPRNDETKFKVPWNDDGNEPVFLGFGTCQDVLVDKHPTERMVIFCGSGTPFMREPEVKGLPMSYPFLLNDSQSWSVTAPARNISPISAETTVKLRKDQLQAAGYYQFSRRLLKTAHTALRKTTLIYGRWGPVASWFPIPPMTTRTWTGVICIQHPMNLIPRCLPLASQIRPRFSSRQRRWLCHFSSTRTS
jgi:hypothetical protein